MQIIAECCDYVSVRALNRYGHAIMGLKKERNFNAEKSIIACGQEVSMKSVNADRLLPAFRKLIGRM